MKHRRGKQAAVGGSQFWVTLQRRSDPAMLRREWQSELFGFGQPQRSREGPATSGTVAAGVAEPGVHQPRLQPYPVWRPAFGRERGCEGAPSVFGVSGGRPGIRKGDRRLK